MLRTIYIFVFFIYSLKTHGQSSNAALHIGDYMPNLEFRHMINYLGGNAKMSDFNGKLVILDFWNLHCPPCIAGFPKMQEIQQEFDGKIQILLVNVINSPADMKKSGFPKNTKSPIIPKTKLPFILYSNELATLFPHASEPYQVWIDEAGKIIATTTANATSRQRIIDYLAGKKLKLPEQLPPDELKIRADKSILDNENQTLLRLTLDNLFYSSIFTRRFHGRVGGSGGLRDSASGNMVGFRINGYDPIHMFRTIIDDGFPLAEGPSSFLIKFPDRVILEVDNPEIFIKPESKNGDNRANWEYNYQLCYELKLPEKRLSGFNKDQRENIIRKMVVSDLERYFGVRVSIEKRIVQCRILIRISDVDKVKTSGGKYINEKTFEGGRIFRNAPFKNVISKFRFALMDTSSKPLMDETGFPEEKYVDLNINAIIQDTPDFRKELNRYGLDMIEAKREILVMVITKNENL